MIPIDIQSLTSEAILELPLTLTIYGHVYQPAGSTVSSGNHFIAVCIWYGQTLYYDGMKSQRMQPVKLENVQNKTGSHAYYFRK